MLKISFKNNVLRKLGIILAVIITLLVSFWPDFHPEKQLNIAHSLPLDMLFHSGYYFFLSTLLRFIKFIPVKPILFFVILFSVSTFLEIAQVCVPKRFVTPSDVISNAIGIAFGVLFYEVVWGKFKNITATSEGNYLKSEEDKLNLRNGK